MEILLSRYKLALFSLLSIFLLSLSSADTFAQEATFSPVFEEKTSNVINLGGSQVVEIRQVSDSGDVLAEICLDGTVGNCRDYVGSMISFQPLCSQKEFTVDYKDGDASEGGSSVKVQKNSRVEVWEVTAPIIYAGSRYVKNDRMPITKEFPTYPSAANYIDSGIARSLCAPGKDCEEVDNVIKTSEKGRFAVGAFASGADGSNVSADERAPVVIDKMTTSYCPAIQDSDPNPDRTNKLAGNLEPRFQTPGARDNSRSFGMMSCDEDNYVQAVRSNVNAKSCVSVANPLDIITVAEIAVTKWFECLEDKDNCEETELFAIRVDSLFGTQTQCAEGDCGNSWFSSVVKSGSAPSTQSFAPDGIIGNVNLSFSEPLYVSTPCKVRIDGSRIESIPCMWDVSPLREWYDRQRKTSGPADPNFPSTFESYLKSVLFDVDRAGLLCEQLI